MCEIYRDKGDRHPRPAELWSVQGTRSCEYTNLIPARAKKWNGTWTFFACTEEK